MKSRYNNLDLFRIICLLGVLVLHNENRSMLALCVSSLGELSVSFFFMMSGALTMQDDSNVHGGDWIKKTIKKLIIPWLIACIIYIAENVFFGFKNEGSYSIYNDLICLKENGYPVRGWHLWFMYSFTEMYLCIPLLKYVRRWNRNIYNILILVSFWLTSLAKNLVWPFIFLNYIWMFLCGDFVFSYFRLEKYDIDSGKKKLLLLLLELLSVFLILLRFERIDGFPINNLNSIGRPFTSNWLILIVIFTFIVNANILFATSRVTKKFLWIYIWSNFVGDFWSGFKITLGIHTNHIWWVLILDTLIIFCVSWLVTEIFEVILKKNKFMQWSNDLLKNK